jgi:hypothetical protein
VTILSIYEQMILSGELVPATGATGVFPDPLPAESGVDLSAELARQRADRL